MLTERIIDQNYILSNLTSIFPSSLILKTDYQIVAVSGEVEKILDYDADQLVGKNILFLIESEFSKFEIYAHELLENGYFNSQPFSVRNIDQEEIYIELSGFYLGLISDLNDLMVLTIRDLRDIKRFKSQLKERKSVFDELVYRTYHDIKGPIATIKGLVNLGKNTKEDIDRIIQLIYDSAHLLDNRITNISKLYELNDLPEHKNNYLDLRRIENEAKLILDERNNYHNTKFRLMPSDIVAMNVNGTAVHTIIVNLIRASAFFRASNMSPGIDLHISKAGNYMKVQLIFTSFECREPLRQKLAENDYNIESAIKDDAFLRFYIARNQVVLLDGMIDYTFSENEIACTVSIPLIGTA